MKTKHLLFLVLLFPLLSGCNDSDDIAKIFLGKTWKLRDIIEGKKSSDYWDGDKEAEAASRELMEQENNCTLKFSGTITGNTINKGTISGKAINNSFSGTWDVDGESRAFSTADITPSTDSDVLGQAFLYGLSHATSYSGDESNLYIYFKEGGKSKFLLLHIPK